MPGEKLGEEMRILFATDHYPPFIGGAHRQAQLLALAMAERGHEVAVATPWHGGLPQLRARGAVAVHRVRQMRTAIPALVRDQRQRHQPPFPDPVTIGGLRRLIADFDPEIVHAYGWMAFSLAVALGRRRIPCWCRLAITATSARPEPCFARVAVQRPGAAQVPRLLDGLLRARQGPACRGRGGTSRSRCWRAR